MSIRCCITAPLSSDWNDRRKLGVLKINVITDFLSAQLTAQ
jgi:hypothetical protein